MLTAIYVRISSDSTGDGLGVARQEADCRALALTRGWEVVGVYRDNDVSAYSGKVRPAYERLLADIEAGEVRAVIAWHGDRLHRSPKELERFIDLAERVSLRVETVQAGQVDLTTASGRMVARQLGAVARYESEHKSDRIKRKLAENAAAGKHHGGSRPYGWNDDRVTPRESEAAVIREAAERVLAGDSVRAIVADLNARGVPTAQGGKWLHVILRDCLLHARHAGLREHRGEVVGTAAWPAIIEPETWRAVRRILGDRSRVTTPGRGGKLHLLSGIATCGVCGAPLRVSPSRGVPAYRCGGRFCVTRTASMLEQFVTDIVLARLSRPDAAHLLSEVDDGGAREAAERAAERVRERLDDAAASFAAGDITARQLTTITAQLRPELTALEAASAPPPDRGRVLGKLAGADDVPAVWEAMTPDLRRSVIKLLMTVTVHKGRKGPGFKTEGIEVGWRS